MDATAREEGRASMPPSGGEAASLVESAMLLRWRAPELALLLADRAVAAAGKDRSTVVRADHLAVVALNRLGRHGEAAHRLLLVLQHANIPAELRPEMQVELAHCAAALGEPGTALAALRPVLAAGDDAAPLLRGTALISAAESCIALGRGDLVPNALEEADELFREDPHLDRDTALLLRATAKAVNAARHRRSGATVDCEAQARIGRELLTGLADPEHDSGQISARLMLETVLALLDRGEGDAAVYEARPMLRRPVRAAAAGAVGWLRLAIATRVHLAKGRHEPALGLLADAVEVTQRHDVDAVLAECLEGLSHVHEVRGEFADALHCLRSARAAERRHRRSTETARCAILEHCGVSRREIPRVIDQVATLLPTPGTLRAVPDPNTGLLDAEEYDCRVEAALIGSAAHSQVLIAIGAGAGNESPGTGLMVELSRRLRKAAPDGAALGQITSDRVAVLLPGMSRHQAQLWADRFRAVSAAQLRADLIVGVAQYRPGTGADQFLTDTIAALCAAIGVTQDAPARCDDPPQAATPPTPTHSAPSAVASPVASASAVVDPGAGADRGTAAPEVADPEAANPDAANPDAANPDAAESTVPAPDPAVPDTVILEVVSARTGSAEGSVHDADAPPVAVEQALPKADGEIASPRSGIETTQRPGEPAETAPTAEEPGSLEVTSAHHPGAQATASPPAALSDNDPPAEPEVAEPEVAEPEVAEPEAAEPEVAEPEVAEPETASGTRHRRGVNGSSVLVSDLLPRSLLSTGRSGRRRAEDRVEDGNYSENHSSENRSDQPSIIEVRRTADGATADPGAAGVGRSAGRGQTGPMLSLAPFGQTSLSEPIMDAGVNGSATPADLEDMAQGSRELPVAGPPPAPMPRALEWGLNGSASKEADGVDVSMGDLLAEALAAFQESGHSLSAGTDTSSAAASGNVLDAGPGSGPRAHRTPGVQLATDPVDRRSSLTADALTDPELRLPDLTAEPMWQRPGTGHRSAAGD